MVVEVVVVVVLFWSSDLSISEQNKQSALVTWLQVTTPQPLVSVSLKLNSSRLYCPGVVSLHCQSKCDVVTKYVHTIKYILELK